MQVSMHAPIAAPVAHYTALGSFSLGPALGLGELSLDQRIAVSPGTWWAWFLDDDAVHRSVDDGQVAEERAGNQLMMIHAEHPGFDGVFPPLRLALRAPIEGARFTAADASMAEALATDDGFYDYLDGTHGVLEGGRGVHVMLTGDGAAAVWAEDGPAPRFLLIELV